jgi:hypothetical protein
LPVILSEAKNPRIGFCCCSCFTRLEVEMDALHFFFTLPLFEQLLLDLLLPPFFVLLCWGSDSLKAKVYGDPWFEDSPKYLGILLGASYVVMIALTIYFHISSR